MRKLHFFALSIILLASCSVQKRHYMKGFYVNHKSKVSQKEPIVVKQETNSFKEQLIAQEPLMTSKELDVPIEITARPVLSFNDECNDVITMKNGDEVKAKVMEVGPDEIKYKRCDNLDGPLVVVNKSDVFMIKYTNGSKEIIEHKNPVKKENSAKSNTPSNNLQPHPLSILSLVMGILSSVGFLVFLIFLVVAAFSGLEILTIPLTFYFITAVTSIVSGIVSLVKINREPTKFNGQGMSITGIVLAACTLVIVLAICAAIFQ